jgi:PhnB protein
MTEPIPEGLEGRVIPYLLIDGAESAIEYYAKAFGAEETYRMSMPDGGIAHAEITVNGAPLYLADAPTDMPGDAASPAKLGGTSVLIHQYVEDVDAVFERAIAAGGTAVREPEDQFYGDRASVVADPFGHHWSLHTHIRDVTSEEMDAAMAEMGGT